MNLNSTGVTVVRVGPCLAEPARRPGCDFAETGRAASDAYFSQLELPRGCPRWPGQARPLEAVTLSVTRRRVRLCNNR